MSKFIMLRRMRNTPQFIIGAFIISILMVVAIFGRHIAPHNPNDIDLINRLTAPQWLTADANGYILGTDHLGRCVLSRIITGTGATFLVSLGGGIITALLGTVLGIIAGYYGGLLDNFIMRMTEVTMAVPTLTLGVVIMAVFGPSLSNLILIMIIGGWIKFARVSRNEVLIIKNREFVQASRALGSRNVRIMFTQIFPNITTPLIIQASSNFGNIILVESALSYLYLGIQAPNPSWGNMIAEGRNYLATSPWLVIAPGVVLMVAVLGFNSLGDGLRDVLAPKQKQ